MAVLPLWFDVWLRCRVAFQVLCVANLLSQGEKVDRRGVQEEEEVIKVQTRA